MPEPPVTVLSDADELRRLARELTADVGIKLVNTPAQFGPEERTEPAPALPAGQLATAS